MALSASSAQLGQEGRMEGETGLMVSEHVTLGFILDRCWVAFTPAIDLKLLSIKKYFHAWNLGIYLARSYLLGGKALYDSETLFKKQETLHHFLKSSIHQY